MVTVPRGTCRVNAIAMKKWPFYVKVDPYIDMELQGIQTAKTIFEKKTFGRFTLPDFKTY